MIKKILIHIIFILVVSCGFQPMLKDFDISNLLIKKINYTGKNELNYILQNSLNLNEKPNSEGLIVNLSISESISSTTKDTAGITTEEQITISKQQLQLSRQQQLRLTQESNNSIRVNFLLFLPKNVY